MEKQSIERPVNPDVKVSICQKCKGIVRASVEHEMTVKSKNEFVRDVMALNLSVKTMKLDKFKKICNEWCECPKPQPEKPPSPWDQCNPFEI